MLSSLTGLPLSVFSVFLLHPGCNALALVTCSPPLTGRGVLVPTAWDQMLVCIHQNEKGIKTFLISCHFVQSFFSLSLCFVSLSLTAYSSMFTCRLSAFPLPSVHACVEMCVCGGARGSTYTYFRECCCKWRDVICNCFSLLLFPFCCCSVVFFTPTQGAFGTLIWLWGPVSYLKGKITFLVLPLINSIYRFNYSLP